MKSILKKYYELDDESKEILPFLYMYEAYLSIKDDYENIEIESLADEELLMQIIIKCWYSTNLDPSNIIETIFEILNCRDITLKDLDELSIEELLELISTDNTNNDSKILSEFNYKSYYCVFCKNNEKYLLIITKDEDSEVIQFDKIEDVCIPAIRKYLQDKFFNRRIDA